MIDFGICLENTAHLQPPSSTTSWLQKFKIKQPSILKIDDCQLELSNTNIKIKPIIFQ